MLLIGIIDELSRQLKKAEQSTDPGILSYFFCQGTDSHLNNATAVLRGLIYLLAIQQPSLISHLRKKYDHAGRQLFEDANAFYALSKIFTDMLQDPKLTTEYLIIDALDECETGLPQLLNLITQTASAPSTHIKWIVSSRYRPDIERLLNLDNSYVRLSLELNAKLVSHAINVYIDSKVSELTSIKHDKVLQDQVRDGMRRKADGTFLWVALVFKELQDLEDADYEEISDVLQALEEVPSGLMPFYDRMMEQIGQLKDRDRKLCRLILSTVILSCRPLHLRELPILAGLKGQLTQRAKLERIVNKCGSFLTIRESHVYLIHQSAKDYLSINASAKIFPTGRADVHYDLFSRSLSALSEILRRDICNFRHPGLLIDQVKLVDPDPLAPVRYSCVFWVDHLYEVDNGNCYAYEDDLKDKGIVHVFLQQKFLYWLEALSLLGSMSDGVLSMETLESLLLVSIRVHDNDILFNNITDSFLEKIEGISITRPSSRCTSIYPFQ
jgi:hypothetical protein